jgi:predicted phosphohydrolase
MKINKNKIFVLAAFLLLCVFATGVYFMQKKEVTGNGEDIVLAEQGILEKENVEVEIMNEVGDEFVGDGGENIEEFILEDDAESLNVNAESEENDAGDADAESQQAKYPALPAPLKKKSDADTLRIGLMTDLHVQSTDGEGKLLSNHYAKKINYFVEKMNNVFGPDFILLNGDIIEGTRTSAEIGRMELSLVDNLFNRTKIDKYWVAGNHDLRSVDKEQWKKALDIDYLHKSFDVGNYKIIILDGNFAKDDSDIAPGLGYTRGKVSQKQLEWLKNELEKTDKRVIVFMHYPPLRDIEAKINQALLYNAREIQTILSQYDVLTVFSGHIEDLYYQELGGVDYFVSPGMVKHPKYPGAFSEIVIKGGEVSITLNYLKEDGKYRTVKIVKE